MSLDPKVEQAYKDAQKTATENGTWAKIIARMEDQLSDNKLTKKDNAYKGYFRALNEEAAETFMEERGISVEAGTKKLLRTGKDGKTTQLDANEEAALRQELQKHLADTRAEHRKAIISQAHLGFTHQQPLDLEGVVRGASEGAAREISQGNFLGVVSGAISGIQNAVIGLIMQIPGIRTLTNWLSSNVSSLFTGQKGLTWEEAGRKADAQVVTSSISAALGGFKGLNTKDVVDDLERTLTFSRNEKATELKKNDMPPNQTKQQPNIDLNTVGMAALGALTPMSTMAAGLGSAATAVSTVTARR